jgi:hypothetical protein
VAFVLVQAALGRTDAAFASLERAWQERRGLQAYIKVEPILDPLRGDPRFRRLLERMRLD